MFPVAHPGLPRGSGSWTAPFLPPPAPFSLLLLHQSGFPGGNVPLYVVLVFQAGAFWFFQTGTFLFTWFWFSRWERSSLRGSNFPDGNILVFQAGTFLFSYPSTGWCLQLEVDVQEEHKCSCRGRRERRLLTGPQWRGNNEPGRSFSGNRFPPACSDVTTEAAVLPSPVCAIVGDVTSVPPSRPVYLHFVDFSFFCFIVSRTANLCVFFFH